MFGNEGCIARAIFTILGMLDSQMNFDPVEADLEFFLEGEELKQHQKIMAQRVKLRAQKEREKVKRRFHALHRKLDKGK